MSSFSRRSSESCSQTFISTWRIPDDGQRVRAVVDRAASGESAATGQRGSEFLGGDQRGRVSDLVGAAGGGRDPAIDEFADACDPGAAGHAGGAERRAQRRAGRVEQCAERLGGRRPAGGAGRRHRPRRCGRNANLPTQSTSNGQTVVTIQQTAQKAILTWSSFNVGQNTTAYFNQSAGTAADGSNGWVALNRVNDPTGVPSQILGQIRAEGSVYLINRNGIIFGGSSQVNVNTFIASSLNLFSNDLSASNNRFLTGGIGDLNSTNFTAATSSDGLDHSVLFAPTAGAGDVTIASSAAITVGNQGLALIAAPNVTNDGVIAAPSGQVALIAGIGVSYDY